MNQSASPDSPEQRKRNEPSPERRRLLKAAAAATPLIATLPCGAARATSSTYQCAIVDRSMTQSGYVAGAVDGEQEGPYPNTKWDGYVRVQGWEYVYSDGGTEITLYTIDPAVVEEGHEDDATFYQANGDTFDDFTGLTRVSADPVGLLKLYVASGDIDDVHSCSVEPCIYPAQQLGSGTGNFGLTGTCLTSVCAGPSGSCPVV